MKILVNNITVDSRIAIRERTDEETIQRYTDILEKLPPIVVFHTDDKYLLADGFHRLAAAVRRGWKYIDAEIKEGSWEEASEFSITANLKHGRPLTSSEYEKPLRHLRVLHPTWTQERLGEALSRSRRWVGYVLAADSVEEFAATVANKLDMSTKEVISRAPKHLWKQICHTAQEQGWTRNETQEKVKAIKAEPSRAQEIIQPVKNEVLEAPADKLITLTKEVNKLCEMQDQFCGKLDPSLYDWRSGALAVHVLQGLYVLAEKTTQLAEKTKRMIEFLESRKNR